MEKYIELLRDAMKTKPKSLRAARQKSSSTPLDVYRMNYNESPFGMPPKAAEVLYEACKRPYIYPDWFSIELKTEIAKLYGLSIDNIVTGSGSSTLICMLGEIFLNPGDEVIFGDPSYEAFRDVINDYGATQVPIPLTKDYLYDLDAMYDAISPKTKMIIICNPNNPTGTFVDSAKVEAFIRKLPGNILIVIDEAYMEYVTRKDSYSMVKLIKEEIDQPLIVLRTFSKIYGMAGVRVGYALTSPSLVDYFNKSSHAWNLSTLGQSAAAAAIRDQDFIHEVRDFMEKARKEVTEQLRALGCKVWDSESNFLLFEAPIEPKVIAQALADEKIQIGSPIGLNRVSLGTKEMNEKFISVMEKLLK